MSLSPLAVHHPFKFHDMCGKFTHQLVETYFQLSLNMSLKEVLELHYLLIQIHRRNLNLLW